MRKIALILLSIIIMNACASHLMEDNSNMIAKHTAVDSVYIYGVGSDARPENRNVLYLERNNNKFAMFTNYPVYNSFGFGRWWHHGDSLILYFIPAKDIYSLLSINYGRLDHRLLIGVKRDDKYIFSCRDGDSHEDSIFEFKQARVMTRSDSSQIFSPYPLVMYNGLLRHIDSIPAYGREKISLTK